MACENVIPYNPRVDKLAATVRQVRGQRKAIQIARQALGPGATISQLRSWASYLGRIERGDPSVRNPSLEVLGKVAKGLGVKLSEFFTLLEGVPTLLDPEPKKVDRKPSLSAVESDTLTPPEADSHHGAEVSADTRDAQTATLAAAILEAAEHIASACDRLATAVATAGTNGTLRGQAPVARPQSSKVRKSGTRRVRKSA